MIEEKGMSNAGQASQGLRTYSAPVMVRYGEIAQLTASGSAGPSESAASPSGMGCLIDNMTNINCPPGGF